MDAEDPEVLSVPGAERLVRERHVGRPARLGGTSAGEEAEEDDKAAEEEEPVGGCVQPRKGHVPCSDHERHEVVAEAGEDRNDEEEDHRRPVDCEELVVAVSRQEVVVGLCQLNPHEQRHYAGCEEEDERGHEVEDADPLVVDGRQPARDATVLPGWGERLRPNRLPAPTRAPASP